ncbi:DUF5788 family protein [Halobacterium wangiae]|uniref:DUF5788 family protein n=1 Tax=Halobacterium wangiae TaxID=2902623 RepID=UPI001E2E9398|nr:DUF5788 family protein [Halobacterium wangiae]
MREYERKQLLERVDREGATIGASIPEEIDLQGESFALQPFVFEVKKHDSVPAALREEVEETKKLLRRERVQRRERLEEADITREDGEEIVAVLVGIDRALNALESLGRTSIEAEAKASERADQKRWYSFLKEALGRDDNEGIRR